MPRRGSGPAEAKVVEGHAHIIIMAFHSTCRRSSGDVMTTRIRSHRSSQLTGRTLFFSTNSPSCMLVTITVPLSKYG